MQHLIGKHVIVGITFSDDDGQIIEYFQTHGRIAEIDPRQGIVLERGSGLPNYHLPPNTDWLNPARPGSYRLKSNGEVVENPDFLTNLTLESVKPDKMQVYKSYGFGPFQLDS